MKINELIKAILDYQNSPQNAVLFGLMACIIAFEFAGAMIVSFENELWLQFVLGGIVSFSCVFIALRLFELGLKR